MSRIEQDRRHWLDVSFKPSNSWVTRLGHKTELEVELYSTERKLRHLKSELTCHWCDISVEEGKRSTDGGGGPLWRHQFWYKSASVIASIRNYLELLEILMQIKYLDKKTSQNYFGRRSWNQEEVTARTIALAILVWLYPRGAPSHHPGAFIYAQIQVMII